MRHAAIIIVSIATAAISSGCGAASPESTQKTVRQSEQFYEAASIAWFEEGNTLAAIRNLTRAVETNPDNDEAHYLLGIIRMSRGEYEAAEKHLSTVIRLRTEKNDVAGLSGAQNNIGVLYIHLKRYDEAVQVLKASSEEVMNREPWLAFGNLGWAYIEMGEYDKAVEVLRRAMFDQPKYCVGLYRIGQALYLKHDYSSALAHLQKALEVPEPGCDRIQEAYQLIGMSRLRLEKTEEAKEAFLQCTEINEVSTAGIECRGALDSL